MEKIILMITTAKLPNEVWVLGAVILILIVSFLSMRKKGDKEEEKKDPGYWTQENLEKYYQKKELEIKIRAWKRILR